MTSTEKQASSIGAEPLPGQEPVKTNGHDKSIDPFDPAALRLDVSAGQTGVKRLLMTVPVRKPNKQEFVRVHPDPEYRVSPIAMVELQPERESFLVPPSMAGELVGMFDAYTLFTAVTRQSVLFLWPVKLPGEDGRQMEWHRSMAEAAEKAMANWVRVRANMALGAYELDMALGALGEPTWPELSLAEILKIAFRDRIVDRDDHIVIRRLRGEV
jgi:hypothetical protein